MLLSVKIITVPDQQHLDPFLSALHQAGYDADDVSILRRDLTTEHTTVTTTTEDGPLEGGVPAHTVMENIRDDAGDGARLGATLGTVGSLALGAALIASGPVGLLGLLGLTATGAGLGALSGLGIGALGGAVESAGETTQTQTVEHVTEQGNAELIQEGDGPQPLLTDEQKRIALETVNNGGFVIAVHDKATTPSLQDLATQYSGSIL